MRLIEAATKLRAFHQPTLTVADASAILKVPRPHASKILARLSDAGQVISLRQGLWAFKDRMHPWALPQYLTAPFPCYVSLYSALYYHGMISQIPSVTYAASLHRTRRFNTVLGSVSIHHLSLSFFFGFEPVADQGWSVATPEKALLDVLYLRPTKTRLFAALPELELPRRFSKNRARHMAERIPSARRRKLVSAQLERLIEGKM